MADGTVNALWNGRIASELATIGIVATEQADAAGFLDDVAIRSGTIHYRRDAAPSNLLHEAGHLACIPTIFRDHAEDALSGVFRIMGEAFAERLEQTGNPGDPLIRAIMQCSDPEATAWAWAFGVRCGVPPEIAILDSEYGGDGDGVRLQVSTGMYIGINGLRAGGMIHSVRAYPALDKWVQDAT